MLFFFSQKFGIVSFDTYISYPFLTICYISLRESCNVFLQFRSNLLIKNWKQVHIWTKRVGFINTNCLKRYCGLKYVFVISRHLSIIGNWIFKVSMRFHHDNFYVSKTICQSFLPRNAFFPTKAKITTANIQFQNMIIQGKQKCAHTFHGHVHTHVCMQGSSQTKNLNYFSAIFLTNKNI